MALTTYPRRLTMLKKSEALKVMKLAGWTKQAELGGDGNDKTFESAFSSLAHAFIADKAPSLLDAEQGFQLLDRSQDNTKAIGVIGFKLGQMQLFAPVFFLQGDLKGHELLYIKDQDLFVPMKENWLNYLTSKKAESIGRGIPRNTAQLGVMHPDLNRLSRSPAKYASWVLPALPAFAAAAMPDLAQGLTKMAADLEAQSKALDLPTFLKQASLPALDHFVKTCQQLPLVAAAMQQHHGFECVSEAIKLAKARGCCSALDMKPVKPVVKKTTGSVLDKPPAINPIKTGALKVITFDATQQTDLPEEINEADQEKLLRDTVLIVDKRDPQETSIVYNTQVETRLFNPGDSGLYEVLVKPGEFERCFIAYQPHGPNGRKDYCTVIRVGDEANWINTHPTRVWACSRIEGKDYDDWYEGLTEAKSLSTGKTRYILVGPKGNSTLPFKVTESLGEETGTPVYEVDFDTYCDYDNRNSILAPTTHDSYGWDDGSYSKYSDGQRIHLNGKQGTKLRSSLGDVYVPEGYKLLTVKPDKGDKKPPSDSGCCSEMPDYGQSETPPIRLGNLVDAELAIMTKTAGLTIYNDGTSCEINRQRMTPLAGLIHLVRDHGTTEKAARFLLKEAQRRQKITCRIKYADPYMTNQGPDAPAYYDTPMNGDNFMGFQGQTQAPRQEDINIPSMSASKTDRNIYNPNPMYDPQRGDQAHLNQSAQTGQKDVFDTAMIGSMLKSVRDDTLVDRYLPDLMKGMDRCARILFGLYWHGDKFAERYGKADMPELEDSLRNNFEGLGDLVLFLKMKTIDASPEQDTPMMDLKDSE